MPVRGGRGQSAGTDLEVCGDGGGGPGTGESGRSPGKAHEEGREGERTEKKKSKNPERQSRPQYGCLAEAGACQRGMWDRQRASKRRGSRRPGQELHGREERSHRGGHTVRGAAARQASQGRGNPAERRDPRRGGRKEAPRRTPTRAGLALRGFPRECLGPQMGYRWSTASPLKR